MTGAIIESIRMMLVIVFLSIAGVYASIRILISKDKIETLLCFITVLLANILIEVIKK